MRPLTGGGTGTPVVGDVPFFPRDPMATNRSLVASGRVSSNTDEDKEDKLEREDKLISKSFKLKNKSLSLTSPPNAIDSGTWPWTYSPVSCLGDY